MLREYWFTSKNGEPPLFFNVKVATIASLGGLLFGYDIGVIAGALPQLSDKFHLDPFEEEFLVSIMLFGAIVGACFGGTLADIVGRKWGIATVCVIFMIGALLLATATSITLLLIGRFIVGIGVAISAIVDVTYLTELSPQSARGRLVSTNELMITIGILLAYTVDFAFDVDKDGWRGMFGVSGVIALVQLISISYMPESPRWLVSNDRLFEARESLVLMYQDMNKSGLIFDDVINAKLNALMVEYHQASETSRANFMGSLILGLSSSVNVWKPNQDEEDGDHLSSSAMRRLAIRPSISPKYHRMVPADHDDDDDDDVSRRDRLRRWRNGSNYNSAVLLRLKQEWSANPSKDDDDDDDVMMKNALPATEIEMTAIQHNSPDHSSLESKSASSSTSSSSSSTSSSTLKPPSSFFPSHIFDVPTKPLVISITLMLFQQLCGNANILYYAPLIFARFKSSSNSTISERDAEFGTVVIGIVKVVFTALSLVVIDKFKRRYLLMTGIAVISISSACLALSFGLTGSSASTQLTLSVIACSVFVAAYSMSFGPLGWLIVSELFDPAVRGTAIGFATVANWSGNLLVSFTFLSLVQATGGPITFGLYATVTAAACVFVYYHVPETSGRK